MNTSEVKHKVRQLKQVELRIRCGRQGNQSYNRQNAGKEMVNHIPLVWDEFFNLGGGRNNTARYTIEQLLRMDKEQYKNMVREFFFHVYYRSCQETGLAWFNLYDPEMLRQLGLPFDADSDAIKKRFRELAKQYHPDAGGNHEEFIKLMDLFGEFKNNLD